MVTEPQSSDLVDPLHDQSGISMFPRTFRVSTKPPIPNELDNIEFIHNYMKSIVLKSPEKLLEQANIILHGSSELMNSKFAILEASENKDEPVVAKVKENQERRPALGRKRAQFSMKSNLNQPSVSLEPSLDITQLQDPEKYFLAHEKFEKAKKELERQRGGVVADLDEYSPSKTARRRRPGILGKSFSYKHHQYSTVLSENDCTMMSSQEKLEQDIPSPDGHGSHPETTGPNVESQNALSESMAKTGNRVNELLDELLSRNCEDLDGDGALSLLKERLQIKPIHVNKLCLPDLHDIGRTDFIPLGEKLPKPRKPLSDIQNFVKGISSRTPAKHKQVPESPLNSLASPTPPKSPFASISVLKKRILQSTRSNDLFSACDIDVECADEESDQVDSTNCSKSLILEKDDIAAAFMGKPEAIRGDSLHQFDKSAKENTELGIGVDTGSSGDYGDSGCYNRNNSIDETLLEENVIRPTTDLDGQGNTYQEMGNNVEDTLQEAMASAQPDIYIKDSTGPHTDFETHRPNEMEENAEAMSQEAIFSVLRDINIEDSAVGKSNSNLYQSDQSGHAEVENHVMDVPSRIPDIGSDQHIEKSLKPSKISSMNEQNEARGQSHEGRKRKAISCRKSLAEAGTFWESGLRRSSRIKMRPLEYWKGERFLYGRIDESSTTPAVIGVKYVSPGKGVAKASIRVKSYVSDEYKELVELAAAIH